MIQPIQLAQATVAILCCSQNSHYKEIEGVDCFDIDRDVRNFAGGMPVVAHPPCRAWSARLRHMAKPTPGEMDLGPLCVDWLRKCGGVLEHPAHSHLWQHCGLPRPGKPTNGDLWSMEVLQTWWGHQGTQKATWLCFSGIHPKQVQIPLQLRMRQGDGRLWETMSKHLRSATCPALAQWLVDAARKSTHNVTTNPYPTFDKDFHSAGQR